MISAGLTSKKHAGESSATIRARIMEARNIQRLRFATSGSSTNNAAMRPKHVREHCALDSESTGYLEQAMEQMHLSAHKLDQGPRTKDAAQPPDASSVAAAPQSVVCLHCISAMREALRG